jgi:hypothetical protein
MHAGTDGLEEGLLKDPQAGEDDRLDNQDLDVGGTHDSRVLINPELSLTFAVVDYQR